MTDITIAAVALTIAIVFITVQHVLAGRTERTMMRLHHALYDIATGKARVSIDTDNNIHIRRT